MNPKLTCAMLLGLAPFSIQANTEAEINNNLTVSIYHDRSSVWDEVFQQHQAAVVKEVEEDLRNLGFNDPNIRICTDRASDCKSVSEGLALNMMLYDFKLGESKSGFRISIDMANQREQRKPKLSNLMPVKCRMTNKDTDELLGMNVSEQVVQKQYFEGQQFDLEYVSEKLTDACYGVINEQRIAINHKGSGKRPTEYPDVYVEERIVDKIPVRKYQLINRLPSKQKK